MTSGKAPGTAEGTAQGTALDQSSVRSGQALVLTSMTLYGMGQTVLYAILPVLGRDLGLAPTEIGLITALSALMIFLCSAAWGRLSDRWGRRRVIVFGLLAYASTTLLFTGVLEAGRAGAVSGLFLLLGLIALRMLFGIGTAGIQPAAAAYMADLSGEEKRTSAMALIGLGLGLGMVLGPAIAAALVSVDLLAPLYVTAALTLVTAVAALTLRSPARLSTQARPAAVGRARREIVPFMILSFGSFLGLAVLQQTLSFLLQDRLRLPTVDAAESVGLVLAGLAVAMIAAQAWVSRARTLDPLVLLRIGLSGYVAGFSILSFAGSMSTMVAAALTLGIGMGLVGPSLLAAASLRASAEMQGEVAGMMSAMPPLAFIVGPLLGTALYTLSPAVPFQALAAIAGGLAVISFLLPKERAKHG